MLCKLHLYGRAIHLRIFCALIIYCFIPSIHLLEAQQFIIITSIFCHLFRNAIVLNANIYFSPRFLTWCCPRPCEEPGICSLRLPVADKSYLWCWSAMPCRAAGVMRDKKTGVNDSTAGDNNINYKAAKGCVNQAEGVNVSFNRPNPNALLIYCKVSFSRFRTLP